MQIRHTPTVKILLDYGLWDNLPSNIQTTEPLGYLDMIRLMGHAKKILTDSGGIQKEAYILGVPCVTLRDTTEWVETLGEGWNVLVGADVSKIIAEIIKPSPEFRSQTHYFGDGDTAGKISRILRVYQEEIR